MTHLLESLKSKRLTIASVVKTYRNWNFHILLGEIQDGATTLEKCFVVSCEFNVHLHYILDISLLGTYP